VPDHPEAIREVLQLLRNIFAKVAKTTAALRAAALSRLMRNGLAGEMIGQRLACGLRSTGVIRLRISCWSRPEWGMDRLHLFQPQFELIELRGELLALPAEKHATELLNDPLQMFYLLCVREQLGLVMSQFFEVLLLLFVVRNDQRLQRFDVEYIEIRRSRTHHPWQYAMLL
jgi:hypothetical protein